MIHLRVKLRVNEEWVAYRCLKSQEHLPPQLRVWYPVMTGEVEPQSIHDMPEYQFREAHFIQSLRHLLGGGSVEEPAPPVECVRFDEVQSRAEVLSLLVDVLKKKLDTEEQLRKAREEIERLKSIVPPVRDCGDCDHWSIHRMECSYLWNPKSCDRQYNWKPRRLPVVLSEENKGG